MNPRLVVLCRLIWVVLGGVRSPAATLGITVQHHFGGEILRLGEVSQTNAAGQALSVTRLDYLLSEFELVSEQGWVVSLANRFAYLSVPGRTRFEVPGVPAGSFTVLRFRVGLPATVNHGDPASVPAGHPLNPTVNGLHWNWQGGYVFMALEGDWLNAGQSASGYSYHLATDAVLIPVELPVALDLKTDRELQLTMDVARIFAGQYPIRIGPDTRSTHSRTNDPLAGHLAENVSRAFTVAGIEDSLTRVPKSRVEHRDVAPTATPYRLKLSRFFPQPKLPTDNPLTEPGVELGRRLFHDSRLSGNGRQSCAACHQSEVAFVDAGQRVSVGAVGQRGTRNSMSLENLAWQTAFFWDGRASTLREQVLQPIENPLEMHASLARVVTQLETADYAPDFSRAFGSVEISADRVARALEQFLLTRVSHDSKFDRSLRAAAELTAEEQRGFELFHTEYDPAHGQYGADCFHCHGGALFTDSTFHNNGLDVAGGGRDLGRFLVTTHRADVAKFKTPSLRNVALTAPYMHDGRFNTLEDVIQHYATGVKRSATLDPNLAKHPDGGVPLTEGDQRALVAFLKSLTDERYRAKMASLTPPTELAPR